MKIRHINKLKKGRNYNSFTLKINGKVITETPLPLSSFAKIFSTISMIRYYVSNVVLWYLYEKFIKKNIIQKSNVEPSSLFFKEISETYNYPLINDDWNTPLREENPQNPNWKTKKDMIMHYFPIYLDGEDKLKKYPLNNSQREEMKNYMKSHPLTFLLFAGKFNSISTYLEMAQIDSPHAKIKNEFDLGTLFLLDNIHLWKIVTHIIKMHFLRLGGSAYSIPLCQF